MFDINPAASIQRIAVFAVPLLLGITCHEVAHGYAAFRQGDTTARDAGRLTLNPIRHMDATGLTVFVLTALVSPFVLGWAKPVPVNPMRFRDPRKGMMLVSAAGPAANFLLAVLFAALLKLCVESFGLVGQATAETVLVPLAKICQAGVVVNLVLGLFNLIPVPPLDGSKIAAGFLPRQAAWKFLSIGRYGFIIIVVLLATGLLGDVLWPVVSRAYGLLMGSMGIPL
ncbi:MAG: site-2 protease family protein [Desulfovibrionaceae bacterium]|jgi:Zn-dependent protease|nr:site-2 protease family protein [Desulfovibrionaceae bacterium]